VLRGVVGGRWAVADAGRGPRGEAAGFDGGARELGFGSAHLSVVSAIGD
jgi:hypothetical protein